MFCVWKRLPRKSVWSLEPIKDLKAMLTTVCAIANWGFSQPWKTKEFSKCCLPLLLWVKPLHVYVAIVHFSYALTMLSLLKRCPSKCIQMTDTESREKYVLLKNIEDPFKFLYVVLPILDSCCIRSPSIFLIICMSPSRFFFYSGKCSKPKQSNENWSFGITII